MNFFRHILLYGLLIVFVCSAPSSVFALDGDAANPLRPRKMPPRILIGPVVGFNQNFHTGGFASFTNDENCPQFQSGNATGFYLGGSFEYLLGDPRDARSSILFRGLLDLRPASFEEVGDNLPSRMQDGDESRVVFSTTSHNAEIEYTNLNLEILYKLMLGETKIGIALGPSVGINLTTSAEQTFNLLEPQNAIFVEDPEFKAKGYEYTNDFRTIVIQNGDVPDKSGIRFGMKAGLLYEVNVKKVLVVPHIFYDFGLTKVTSTDDWRVSSLQAGVDIRFAF